MASKVTDYYSGIDTPKVADMELQLQELVLQGVLTPEDAQAALAGDSAMGGITLDPRLKEAQMSALQELQGISDAGGMNLTDQNNLRKIQGEQNAAARGQREAILQNAQQRGLGGSGLELMSQMKNQQEAATRASNQGMDVAAQAQERALQALMQGGQMAGNMENQSFNQQAQVAGAQDAISKFNAQNQQQTNMLNTGARNDAQQMNLQARQNISNANADTRNRQQQYNKQLLQQNFENQITKAGGQTGVSAQNAAAAAAKAAADKQQTNQLIGAGLTAGGYFMGGPAGGAAAGGAVSKKADGGLVMGDPSDMDTMPHMLQPGEMVVKKDDVPDMLKRKHTKDDGDFDAAAFLDDITGGKYGYAKKEKA